MCAGTRMLATQFFRHGVQPFVTRPEPGTRCQRCAGQQVNIDKADALAMQAALLDESQNLIGFGHDRRWKVLQQIERDPPLGQTAAGDFADDERVHQNPAAFEQLGQGPV